MSREDFITKDEFVNRLCEKSGLTRKGDVNILFYAFCECLHEVIVGGENINLPEVGTFTTQVRKHRYARNPRTGEKLYVPEGQCVKFTAAKSIKQFFRDKREAEGGAATKEFPEK